MFEQFSRFFKKEKKIFRIENKKSNVCYKICYNMASNTGGSAQCSRKFDLPEDIVDRMNNGYDLESIEIRDEDFKIISIGSFEREG